MKYRRIQTNDETLNRIQSQIQAAFTDLMAEITAKLGTLKGARLLTGVSLTAAQDNKIAHGLGRAPTIWIIARKTANAVIWEVETASMGNTAADAVNLNLWTSANCTVSILVN